MIREKTRRLVFAFLILILVLGLVGCNSGAISLKPGEQTVVTRLVHDRNGCDPFSGLPNAMQGGKGAKDNKVPVHITTTKDGKQYFKLSFDGYTNVNYDEHILTGRGDGGSDLDLSETATTVIEPFEVRGEIDGDIEPIEIKIHYTYETANSGVLIDEDIVLHGTGTFPWKKYLKQLELHVHWNYVLNAPNYPGTGISKGNVEAYQYYIFDLPETVSNQQGLLTSSKIATKADKDAGETGVTIPEALAIILIGGGAALAGAGAGGSGGGSGGDGDSKNGKKSRYKMCLKKDFGDAIRYDVQPVTVYARIVEITPEGEEIDRPDLSTAIELFSGGGLKVESTAMAGNYMGALVCAESVSGRQNPDSGVLSIRFSGEGGSFQNDVTFRLIGKPYLTFPEQGQYLTMTLPMLLGDGELYETPFLLHDFMEKPVTVKAEVAEGAPLACTIEETGENQYLLKVRNNSVKPEGPQATKQMTSIGLRAENEQELAEESLNVELYPEGLSIREVKMDENGRVLIGTFDNEDTEEFGDVRPTGFVLDFVVPVPSEQGGYKVKVLQPEEFSPTFAGLQGTDERTKHLAEKFKYTITEVAGNLKEYKFAPQEALVEEEGKPYNVTLPISCPYGEREYKLELPLRLLGGGPGPMAGWDAEFALMKRIVSRVGGISPDVARVLRENGRKMSTAELRLINKRICHDAIIYYTNDAAGYEKIAAELDSLITYAEWIKWVGDQAFSYLISTYYGETVDAILSPAKDIFASFLGEAIGTLALGEKFDFETLEVGKNINTAFDNLITNAFDEQMGKKLNYKQVCAVVGGFLIWKMAKNLYDNIDQDGKIDLYGAITATTTDLTAMGLKSIAGKFFDKALKSKAVQKNLNKPLGRWLQDLLPDTSLVKWKNSNEYDLLNFSKSEIFKKYLEELFGEGLAKVTEIDMEAMKGFTEIMSGNSIESTLDLGAWPEVRWTTVITGKDGQTDVYAVSVNLGPESLGKLCDYLFAQLFGEISLPQEAKTPPADPPFYPQGEQA